MRLSDLTEYEEYGNKKENVDVSIWCLTYNHVDYIRKALEGFLNQKTSFAVEVLVYDDASTDGTSDIVREYATRYPDLIHAFISKKNLYKHPNRQEALRTLKKENLTGKYVALCEGDDYWIYDQKLQKQYDYMEDNPSTSMCYHNAICVNEKAKEYYTLCGTFDSGIVPMDEMFTMRNGCPPTASMFIKSEYYFSIPSNWNMAPVGDALIRWWSANCGDIYYFDKVWSIYNYMHEGSWSKNIMENKNQRISHYMTISRKLIEFSNDVRLEQKKLMKKRSNVLVEQCARLFCENSTSIYDVNNELDKFYKKYGYYKRLEEWIRIEIKRNKNSFIEYVIEKCKNHVCKLYIYGIGKEAAKWSIFLNENNIEYDGYIVTEERNRCQMFNNKPVFLNEKIQWTSKANLILGLNYNNRYDVCMMLDFDNYDIVF